MQTIRVLCAGPALAAVGVVVAMHAALAQENCKDTPEGRVCTVHQEIVAGNLVSPALQQSLGLVSVGGGCSGTLMNRFWVLTADHCVTTNGQFGGPSAPFANVRITAAWSARVVTPTRYVRYGATDNVDVALVFLGGGDFGAANLQFLHVGQIDDGMTVTKYGRGIYAYATTSGRPPPTPIPAAQDGRYRSAPFSVSNSGNTTYTTAANATGQVGNGGDSGGPDFLTAPGGIAVGIAGVQSTCRWTACLPGKSCTAPNGNVNWTWVTSIPSCNSAPIFNVRDRIIRVAEEGRFPCRGVSAGCTISEIANLLLP